MEPKTLSEASHVAPPHPGVVSALADHLYRTLQIHPQGLGEFELLKQLQSEKIPFFDPPLFKDPLTLFRAHFLLFHALYHLRDRLLQEDTGKTLRIGPLEIRIIPRTPTPSRALDEADPMGGYYRDLTHWHTSKEEVQRLLGRFWSRWAARDRQREALEILGLSEPVKEEEIRKRYRTLALEHHPDRGGDPECFRALREALDILAPSR